VPEWAKIVADCLALVIGASAPSLILVWLNPPSPASGESRYERNSSAEHEHRNGEAAQRKTQEPSPGIPAQEPQHQKAVGTQTKHKSEGDSGAEWWLAFWTFWLFIATTGLWFFTGLMWLATRRAVSEGQQAIAAARTSAEATQSQATTMARMLTASHRAWIKIEISLGDQPLIFDDNGVSTSVQIIMRNVGSAPALHVTPHAWLVVSNSDPDSWPVQVQSRKCDELRKNAFGVGYTLFPDEVFPQSEQIPSLRLGVNAPKADVERGLEISTEKNAVMIHVVGCAEYTFPSDLGVHHQTRFIYELMPRMPFATSIQPALGRIEGVALDLRPHILGAGRLAD
jgi:hypothetical protein